MTVTIRMMWDGMVPVPVLNDNFSFNLIMVAVQQNYVVELLLSVYNAKKTIRQRNQQSSHFPTSLHLTCHSSFHITSAEYSVTKAGFEPVGVHIQTLWLVLTH